MISMMYNLLWKSVKVGLGTRNELSWPWLVRHDCHFISLTFRSQNRLQVDEVRGGAGPGETDVGPATRLQPLIPGHHQAQVQEKEHDRQKENEKE